MNGSGCWIWNACEGANRYGSFRRERSRKPVKAHRYSYELAGGYVPEGMGVLHSCDVKSCVNPAHLRIGSHADNMQDVIDRKRRSVKLSADDLQAIRALRDKLPQKRIAEMFGIANSYVSRIFSGVRRSGRVRSKESK